jgi:hypothetical protein
MGHVCSGDGEASGGGRSGGYAAVKKEDGKSSYMDARSSSKTAQGHEFQEAAAVLVTICNRQPQHLG